MNEDRMHHLNDILRKDAANPVGVKFNLAFWAAPANSMYGCFESCTEDDAKPEIEVSCDTQACAFGLSALDPVFRAQGLDWKMIAMRSGRGMMVPTFDGHSGMGAAAAFFDISDDDANYLFDPSCYETVPTEAEGELEVADRVVAFMSGDIDYSHHPAGLRDDDEAEQDDAGDE